MSLEQLQGPVCVLSMYMLCSVCFAVLAMAQGEPAGFGYWIGILVKASGLAYKDEVPREKRILFRKLARLLVDNEFEHVSQLENVANLLRLD